ncbi:EF-P lysine aminoacylase GenX [Halorhodospira sp. 9621]|uniref:EF-P lysine aminoacylase EpmA n=1 Tax=Halorhodospira TaxID=85108 RepID=UPI001914B42C|nr:MULTISPECIES: EF-P lysine aminoacylase EpmA [Halorhodospira]MBK5944289.1 EF-P lysine aminoacylase GenX [Halorhodospira halophila]MCG5527590.1 EF-P lysine aminoacylase GenX [Halorhodospira halophila]MCG5532609.1 EF-P lysine aminoacylase GenX [Halorhodospira sp. 9621]MCG5538997.1 EF-P lysine aminoacylase GenX [Halorhodospira sp. 9622]MCG5544417.1 EF-P lysine aminoacylase GenX [Halorhodospira sp. 9628]
MAAGAPRGAADGATVRRVGRELARIRRFLAEREVLEVQPPCLGPAAMDPALESISVPGAAADGATAYLQTSPESAMKAMLAAGSGDIYYLGPAWRGGECGRWHAAEFTLLEWYRIGFDHHHLMDEVAALAALLVGDRPVERWSYQGAFRHYAGVDPLADADDVLRDALADQGIELHGGVPAGRDETLDLLLSHAVGPALGHGKLTFLDGFPASQAALARLDDADPRTARRFELFIDGLEIANGYHELTDAAAQRERFRAEQAERRGAGQPVHALDERLLTALEQGVPDCAGVALGVDRLLALALGASSLREVRGADG